MICIQYQMIKAPEHHKKKNNDLPELPPTSVITPLLLSRTSVGSDINIVAKDNIRCIRFFPNHYTKNEEVGIERYTDRMCRQL